MLKTKSHTDLEPTQLERAAWNAYQRMRLHLDGRLGRELARETGLSEADAGILIALDQSTEEAVRALALRCGLEWEKSRLSHQLRRMEQRGLILRETCDEDQRGSVVRLTPAGREAAREATRFYDDAMHRYLTGALDREQLVALREIAETALSTLEVDREDEPAVLAAR